MLPHPPDQGIQGHPGPLRLIAAMAWFSYPSGGQRATAQNEEPQRCHQRPSPRSTTSHLSREHLPQRNAHNHDAEQEHEPGFQPVGVVLEGDGVAEEQHWHDVEQECDEHAADD